MSHKRPAAGTLQAQVWRQLRAGGPQSAAQLAAALGRERESCRRACEYLLTRRKAARALVGKAIVYRARGDAPPTDLRGKPRGCRNHRGAIAYASWVKMMADRHGSTWRPPTRGATELERCWR